jgi:hypothetical protein
MDFGVSDLIVVLGVVAVVVGLRFVTRGGPPDDED